jgi:hypothetical protein
VSLGSLLCNNYNNVMKRGNPQKGDGTYTCWTSANTSIILCNYFINSGIIIVGIILSNTFLINMFRHNYWHIKLGSRIGTIISKWLPIKRIFFSNIMIRSFTINVKQLKIVRHRKEILLFYTFKDYFSLHNILNYLFIWLKVRYVLSFVPLLQ